MTAKIHKLRSGGVQKQAFEVELLFGFVLFLLGVVGGLLFGCFWEESGGGCCCFVMFGLWFGFLQGGNFQSKLELIGFKTVFQGI